VRVIAHRTCPVDAPENSVAGIRIAATQHADLVEVDVRLTRDRVPVLCHDAIPWRTLGYPLPVRRSRLRSLQRRSARHGTMPPTLEQAAAAVPAFMGMAVDLKDGRAWQPVVQVLDACGLLDRSELWVRHRSAARALTTPPVGLRRALLRSARTPAAVRRYIGQAADLHVEAISIDDTVITAELVEEAHGQGLLVYCWVRQPDGHEAAGATGCDALVTDWPARARAAAHRG
jgi:glycerophosphoryl diester phosphodiesterase